jgi:acyl-activating enzyme 14
MGRGRSHVGHSLSLIAVVRACLPVTICVTAHKTGLQFLDRVAARTNGLVQLGLKEGDVVAIAALNSDLYLEWLVAIICAGCIVAPLNYRWSFEEACLAVGQVNAVMLVMDNFCLAWSNGFMNIIPSLHYHVFLGTKVDCMNTQLITVESVGQYAGGFEELDFRWAPDSTALICFTSGITGKPKGVALSHSALIVQSLTKIALIGYNNNDVYLHTSPLCHIGGISLALALLMAGACHVFIPKFEAASTLNVIQKHSVTAMIIVPTMLADIVTYYNPSRSKDGGLELCFPTVKKILNGAGSLSPQLLESAIELLPRAQFFSAYGMTEACSSMTFMVAYDPMIGEGTPSIRQKFTMALDNQDISRDHSVGVCVGKPTPHVEIQIEPSNTFLYENEVYNVGNILTKGPHVMQKYWGQKEATAAAFSENGWLNTGDAGWIDKEGRLWLLGRSKDMIKSGGENIYPSEVEKILLNHPGILAVGIPDFRLNELVTASIQLQNNWQWEDENLAMQSQANNILSQRLLQLYCKQQGLSGFKVPRIFFPQREPFP